MQRVKHAGKLELNFFAGSCKQRSGDPELFFSLDKWLREAAPLQPGWENNHLFKFFISQTFMMSLVFVALQNIRGRSERPSLLAGGFNRELNMLPLVKICGKCSGGKYQRPGGRYGMEPLRNVIAPLW